MRIRGVPLLLLTVAACLLASVQAADQKSGQFSVSKIFNFLVSTKQEPPTTTEDPKKKFRPLTKEKPGLPAPAAKQIVPQPPALPPVPLSLPEQKHFRKDSLAQFSADITTVLTELRADSYDPTVSSIFHCTNRPTFAVTWTHEMWEIHTSRWRFINQILYWHKSALLLRVLPQLTALMCWTYFAIQIVETKTTALSNIKLPMTSLSLVSGFVGSLLALRSNQGLSRLMEARQSFGRVVFYTRDMSSIIRHFVYPKDPELGLKLARHLAIFSWLLKNFLRGTKMSGTDDDLIRTMLPKADADYVLRQRKKPVAVVMRLRQALHHLSEGHKLTTAEELAMDHTIQSLDQSIMLTERIVASPIPPLFTTHAGRLLVFYLFFLPLALHSSGSMDAVGTFVTVLAVGYAMLGLDEISHLMEQPFRLAPLYHLCKNAMRDVADSFCLTPPSIDDSNNGRYVANKQPYWATDIADHDGFE
jgi:putative membrane protein